MKNKKTKAKMSRMFQKLVEGDRVSVVRELSEKAIFPKNLQGRTGLVEGRRGKAYIVKIIQGSKAKKYIILPVHLKKLK